MTAKYIALLIVTVFASFFLCSCSDEDTPTQVEVVVPASGFYATLDSMMGAFRGAYEEMDVEILGDVLHPDFQMILSDETKVDFPELGLTFDRDQELTIAEHMFSGATGVNSEGQWEASISSSEFTILNRRADWVDSDADGDFPGTQVALYDVRILFFRTGFSTFNIEGTLQFYAAGKDSTVNGTSQTYWKMVGQKDFTGRFLKAIEQSPWGSVKALYR